jgi:hypothetical protein
MMQIGGKVLVLAVMFCWAQIGFTQEQKRDQAFLDSILPRLSRIKADSNAVDQLLKLSQMYHSVNADSTILFADRGDSIAESIHYYRGQIMCLVGSAMGNVTHSNWANATLKMNKALPICQQHEPDLLLLMYNIMFAISGIKGEIEEAAEWKNKQLGLIDSYTGPEWVKWPTYMQMTIFYERAGQMDSARFYADSLKVYLNKYKHQSGAIKRDSYMALGQLALTNGDTTQALQYFGRVPTQ